VFGYWALSIFVGHLKSGQFRLCCVTGDVMPRMLSSILLLVQHVTGFYESRDVWDLAVGGDHGTCCRTEIANSSNWRIGYFQPIGQFAHTLVQFDDFFMKLMILVIIVFGPRRCHRKLGSLWLLVRT
jgi:hypothetical protein